MKEFLTEIVEKAINSAGYHGVAKLEFEKPKVETFGDLTTNVAMLIAKATRKKPREVAEQIINAIERDEEILSRVEIAGPGFINFFFTNEFFLRQLKEILKDLNNFGRSNLGNGKKTQVEYVSANPTGPLSVGHGRQAAIGDTIANLLEWTGHNVTREYYYNNAGRQMKLLAESTYSRYRQLFEPDFPFPEDGYQGDYIKDIALELRKQYGESLINKNSEEALEVCKEFAEKKLFDGIKNTLARMGVRHDVYYNEDSLYTSGKVQEVIEEFRKRDLIYEKEGAIWLKTSALGLEQDRVIVKSTGEPTYRLPDIAYHREKFKRGFELIVDIFGADHIATVPDVLAGLKALGYDTDKIKVVIHQFVTLFRDGEQVKMSKRLANFVTLDELLDEVGPDAARYFFVMRSISSHLEFDLNLAKEQSEKNPVYYLQYAHARISSILRFAESEGLLEFNLNSDEIQLHLLKGESEIALVKLLVDFPEVIEMCATSFEPHHLTTYLHEVSTAFHKFYHEHRVVIEDRELARARLALCIATKTVLANGCKILGISAPDKM